MLNRSNSQITAPLLHLLSDDEPDRPEEDHLLNYIDLSILKKDIRDNLENILNTRLGYFDFPPTLPELKKSILNYGIVDFTKLYYLISQHQRELCHSIEESITHFEPRLQKIHVSMLEKEQSEGGSFLIHIDSLIHLKPEPCQAIFETKLDLLRYQFSFEEEK